MLFFSANEHLLRGNFPSTKKRAKFYIFFRFSYKSAVVNISFSSFPVIVSFTTQDAGLVRVVQRSVWYRRPIRSAGNHKTGNTK